MTGFYSKITKTLHRSEENQMTEEIFSITELCYKKSQLWNVIKEGRPWRGCDSPVSSMESEGGGVSISTIGGLIYISWSAIFLSLMILLYLLQLGSSCGLVRTNLQIKRSMEHKSISFSTFGPEWKSIEFLRDWSCHDLDQERLWSPIALNIIQIHKTYRTY